MIYVHFPFCRTFCTYCDFYSVTEKGKEKEYNEALLGEISARRSFLDLMGSSPCDVKTFYVGGGTPSLASDEFFEIMASLASRYDVVEFTVEVNPDDVTPRLVSLLRECGVNRVSMGVQSFNDVSLRWMNRRHDSAGAIRAYRMLREGGFDNISLDLIFGYDPAPSGTSDEAELLSLWREDLTKIISLEPEHISAYQMGIEAESLLGCRAHRGEYVEPTDELCAAQYEMLQQMLEYAGYCQYEISNFAKKGFSSKHNSAYWERVPYIGLGPGAHSFDGRCRMWNLSDIERYIAYYHYNDHSVLPFESEELDSEDIRVETIMLGLRRCEGMELSVLNDLVSDRESFSRLCSCGALAIEGGRVFIPKERLFVSDSVIREL